MAIIYFSNTANAGAGSLREALANATEEDVVVPDPDVFRRGERITIELSRSITIAQSATLRAGACRPRLRNDAGIAVYATTGGAFLNVEGFEFVGRVIAYFPESRFSRCVFAGNAEAAHAVQGAPGAAITLEDCLVVGAKRAGFYIAGEGSSMTVVRSTVVGNAEKSSVGSRTTYVELDSIVDPVPSTAGFVAPPPDDYDASWNAAPWEAWNLALLPESPFADGATSAEGAVDLSGLARGRDVDGTTRFARGAFEIVDADYYLAESAGDDFSNPENWRTTQGGATRPDAVASGVFYLGENATWRNAPPDGAALIVPGRRRVSFEENVALTRLTLGENATVALSGEDRILRVTSLVAGSGALVLTDAKNAYLVVDALDDVDEFAGENVAVTSPGAGIVEFDATSRRPGSATLSWRAQNDDATIRLERRDPSGRWFAVAQRVDASVGEMEVALGSGRAAFRAFDGETFWYDDAWSFSRVQLSVVATAVPGERAAILWEATTTLATTTDPVTPGQGVSILARIFDAFDRDATLLADGDNIESVTYTCYYVSNGLFEETLAPVQGHEEVDAGKDCVLEALQRSDAWNLDDVGYSFVLTPNVRDAPLFEKPGEYRFRIVVRLTSGNPATFYVPVTVVDA